MNVCIILLIYILIANAVAILNRGKIKTQRFSCISPWNKMLLHRIAILGDVTRCLASSNKNIFTNFFLRPCISHETKAVKNPTVRNRCIFTIFSNLDFSVKWKLFKARQHKTVAFSRLFSTLIFSWKTAKQRITKTFSRFFFFQFWMRFCICHFIMMTSY